MAPNNVGHRGPDLLEFWSKIDRGETVHPDDRDVFRRIDARSHGFRMGCLPACFTGPLRTAPVVLLLLSPGFEAGDLVEAQSDRGKDAYARRWTGRAPLPGPDLCGHGYWRSRTRLFGCWRHVQDKVAILNIGAYHSENFKESYHTLAALPSSRVSLDWAQRVLFPEAEDGARIVICLRAARYWGLERGRQYSGTLFAPPVTAAGHLHQGPCRDQIVDLVRTKIGYGPRCER